MKSISIFTIILNYTLALGHLIAGNIGFGAFFLIIGTLALINELEADLAYNKPPTYHV